MLTLELLDSGHCVVPEWQVMRGGARRSMDCHALVALISHPHHGRLLFDAGYAPRMLEATRRWPFRLYRQLTPLRLRPELAVAAQLAARGIAPAEIGTLIISHFHADHIAGLRDFPTARFVAARAALDCARSLRGLAALRRGIIPALLPPDLDRRAVYAESLPAGPELPHLGPTRDLFGDGSLLLVALPGHARGQLGALLATTAGPVLLAADGAWTSRAIRELRPPSRLTNLLVDDPRAVQATLAHLHAFAQARPATRIIPTHCPEVYAGELTARR
jgi:glyoxylase-like metal-dependent hydrolase (beta-lactamase superfamily II)